MSKAHILGFPRIGRQRELKWALESFWKGETDADALEQVASTIKQQNWQWQKEASLDFVSVGDFSYYDHVLDTSLMLGVVPKRFAAEQDDALRTYFKMARGGSGDQTACEMTKWFDTNYHYIVPEFELEQTFVPNPETLLSEIQQAQSMGLNVKPVLLGPLSYLFLGKMVVGDDEAKLALLDKLVAAYKIILLSLESAGVEWVQIDEPILSIDLPVVWRQAFESVYSRLQTSSLKLLLATYFSYLGDHLNTAVNLPVAGLHVDAVESPGELSALVDCLPNYKVLSVGIVDGRNVWKNNYEQSLSLLEPIKAKLKDRLWVSSSCSLLHSPVDLSAEDKLDAKLKPWLSFARQKLHESSVINSILNEGRAGYASALQENLNDCLSRARSELTQNDHVEQALDAVTQESYQRLNPYQVRCAAQKANLGLPIVPTTTIGSFPQTASIRKARADYRKGKINFEAYEHFIENEIRHVIEQQEALGLDVLVHGEPERNDMVEYFGELLEGCLVTQNAWVQSYGSRCVKPPIIYGDVYRKEAMTVRWAVYAQAQSAKPVKAMLTGPLTILKWSFVRDDQPREKTCKQLALALRAEVCDLEQQGIKIIQIDEPALREALPLHQDEQKHYLKWAIDAFRLSSSAVQDKTQIHSHMCYSEFNGFIEPIIAMDADVITVETSRSDNEFLKVFEQVEYPNEIGPGVYDIHSPRIPSVDEIEGLLKKILSRLPQQRVWVNPDCGLKTRAWPEVRASLENMVLAAQALRSEYQLKVAG